MINFMLGPPGGGKSYETTVYHVLPALEAGRNRLEQRKRSAEVQEHAAIVGQID